MPSIWSSYSPEANELDRLCARAQQAGSNDVLLARISRRAHQQRLQQALRERLRFQHSTLRVVEMGFDSRALEALEDLQRALSQSSPQLVLLAGLAEPLVAEGDDGRKAARRFQAACQFLLSWPVESTCRLLLWVQEPTLIYLAEHFPSQLAARADVFAFMESDPAAVQLLKRLEESKIQHSTDLLNSVVSYIQQPSCDCDHELASALATRLLDVERPFQGKEREAYRRAAWSYLYGMRKLSRQALDPLARSAARVGNPGAALQFFERVAHSAAEHSDYPELVRAELGQADALLQLGKLPAAFDQYRFALRLARQHVEPQFVAPAAVGLRACVARQQAASGSCEGLSAPVNRSPYERPLDLPSPMTRQVAHALIAGVLDSDWELDQFWLTHFPSLATRISLESEHSERIEQLLQYGGEKAVLAALTSAEPARMAAQRYRLEPR